MHEQQFSTELDVENAPPATRSLIIASTPRSGSHMLGHSMTATNVMGRPFEYANLFNLPFWEKRFGTTGLPDSLAQIMRLRTTPNGLFSIKLHYSHLENLGGLTSVADRFPDPHFIFIYRSETLKQAFSLAKAHQTGVWIDGMQGNGKPFHYNYQQVRQALEEICLHNALWRHELKSLGVPVLELEFDTVRQNTPDTLRQIAEFADLQLSSADAVGTPPTRPQSTAESYATLLDRFARDNAQAAQASARLARGKRVVKRLLGRG